MSPFFLVSRASIFRRCVGPPFEGPIGFLSCGQLRSGDLVSPEHEAFVGKWVLSQDATLFQVKPCGIKCSPRFVFAFVVHVESTGIVGACRMYICCPSWMRKAVALASNAIAVTVAILAQGTILGANATRRPFLG